MFRSVPPHRHGEADLIKGLKHAPARQRTSADPHSGTNTNPHGGTDVSGHSGTDVNPHSGASNVSTGGHSHSAISQAASATYQEVVSTVRKTLYAHTSSDPESSLESFIAIKSAHTITIPTADHNHQVVVESSGGHNHTQIQPNSHSVYDPNDHTVYQPNSHTVTQPGDHVLELPNHEHQNGWLGLPPPEDYNQE